MTHEARRTGRGFTLVELLIVISIIAVLIVLSVAVAGRVSGAGKARNTEQTIRLLDSALEAYINAKGGPPGPTVVDPRPGNTGATKYIQPVADARSETSGEMINSVALFMAQCRGIPSAEENFKSLDAKFVREFNPETGATPGNFQSQPSLPTVFDAWGKPIRYVHPAFKGIISDVPGSGTNGATYTDVSALLGPAPAGTQYGIQRIRRNTVTAGGGPDADGGMSPANRPYFYSAGPDGDPSTMDDNVYLNGKPQLQKLP